MDGGTVAGHGHHSGKEKTPSLRICHLIVKHVNLAFGLGFLFQSSLIVLTIVLYLLGSNVFPADFTDVPLELTDDPSYRRVKAWNRRDKDSNERMYLPQFLNVHQHHTRHEPADVLELYYEVANDGEDDSNILTGEQLSAIYKFEQRLTNLPYYHRFCVLNDQDDCLSIQSLLPLLKSGRPSAQNAANPNCQPPASDPRCAAMPNQTSSADDDEGSPAFQDSEINHKLELFAKTPSLAHKLQDVLDKNTHLDVFPIQARSLRSYMLISWAVHPPEEGETPADNVPHNTKEYASNHIGPALWETSQTGIPYGEFGDKQITFYYYNPFLYYDRLKVQVIDDLLLATGSFFFVFIFLWIQTRSVFITSFGIFGILTNFFGANLIYRYIFDYRYFGVFNVLSVFIILGIGVDDIFVFNDAWTATEAKAYESLGHRLSDAYKKSATSMFITSFTTTAAFVVNAFSPLLAIRSFGLFSACLVVFNYFSVITFFPCVVAIHHIRILNRGRDPDELMKPKPADESKLIPPKASHARIPILGIVFPCFGKRRKENGEQERGKLSQKLCSLYKALIWMPGIQALFLIFLAGLLGFLSYSATRLQVDTEPVRLYIQSHPMGKSLYKRKTDFNPAQHSTGVNFVQIYFVWGIEDLDRSMCHKTAWKSCTGKLIWDNSFDLNAYHAQRDLLWFCQYLRNLQQREQKELHFKTTDGVPDVNCFIDDLDRYLEKEFSNVIFTKRKLMGLPTTDTKIDALMLQYQSVYQPARLEDHPYFSRYFETGLMHWLHDGYKFLYNPRSSPMDRYQHYGRYIDMTVLYGTRLRYAGIVVNTTLSPLLGYQDGMPVLEKWEKLFDKAKRRMGGQLSRGVLITPDRNEVGGGIFHWFKVQKTLTSSALKGVAISLCLALPVLILSTDDFVIGGIATLIICATSVSVIGIIPLAGWRLGVLESLNLTLVVGLAIDYIVHVAEAYHLSTKPNRREKVSEILEQIGVSVISGAVSTLGASLFMLFAKIAFFMQFGLFIFCTVGFSLLYSLGMFIVLLSLIGPDGDTYSLKKQFKRLWSVGRWKRMPQQKINGPLSIDVNDDDCTSLPPCLTSETDLSTVESEIGVVRSGGMFSSSVGSSAGSNRHGDPAEQQNSDNNTGGNFRQRSRSKCIDDDNISSGYDSSGTPPNKNNGTSSDNKNSNQINSKSTTISPSDPDDADSQISNASSSNSSSQKQQRRSSKVCPQSFQQDNHLSGEAAAEDTERVVVNHNPHFLPSINQQQQHQQGRVIHSPIPPVHQRQQQLSESSIQIHHQQLRGGRINPSSASLSRSKARTNSRNSNNRGNNGFTNNTNSDRRY